MGWGGESFQPFDNVFDRIIFLLPKQIWSLLSKYSRVLKSFYPVDFTYCIVINFRFIYFRVIFLER